MNTRIKLSMVISLIIIPLLIGYSQQVQPPGNKPDSSQKIVELQQKLDAKLEAVNTAIDAKVAEVEEQKAAIQKPPPQAVKKRYPSREVIIYRDTCMPRIFTQAPVIDSVDHTIKPPEVVPVVLKLKWYQFRRLHAHRKIEAKEPEN